MNLLIVKFINYRIDKDNTLNHYQNTKMMIMLALSNSNRKSV